MPRLGAWIDRRGVMGGWEHWRDLAAQLRLDDVSLVAHAQDARRPFKPFVSATKLGAIVRSYADLGVVAHVMLWPQPVPEHCVAVLQYLQDVHEAARGALGSGELDCEEQWTRRPRTSDETIAAAYRAGWPDGLPLVVNGITAALPKFRALLAVADVAIPQAYTSATPGQGSTPGARQTQVLDTWRKVMRPEQLLCCGLAAYRQEGAGGLKASAAMRVAYDAAVAGHVPEVRWWSLPDFERGSARDFLESVVAHG